MQKTANNRRLAVLARHLYSYSCSVYSKVPQCLQKKLGKPNLFARVPANEKEFRLAVLTLLKLDGKKELEAVGIKVEEKAKDTEVQILLSDDNGSKFLLKIFNSEIYRELDWRLLPYVNFSDRKPLHEEAAGGKLDFDSSTISYSDEKYATRFCDFDFPPFDLDALRKEK